MYFVMVVVVVVVVVAVVYSQSEDWRSQESLLGKRIFRNPLPEFELGRFSEIRSSVIKL